TLRAREVHLPASQMEGGASGFEMRARRAVGARRYRGAQRLPRDVRGDGEHIFRLVTKRLRALAIDPAGVDASFKVEELPARLVDFRIARRDPANARALVAACAGNA